MPRSLLQQIFRTQDGTSQPQQMQPTIQPLQQAPLSARISTTARTMMNQELQSPGMDFVEEPTFQHRMPSQMQQQSPISHSTAHVSNDEHNELIHRLTLELSRMKKQIQELESKAQTSELRYNEIVGSQKKIYDRVQSALQLFDERLKSVCQDLASRFSVLRGKMTEQKGYETKVEELLDRHNALVNGFESRMDNMNRVIKEQEMQLLTFKSLFQQLSNRK